MGGQQPAGAPAGTAADAPQKGHWPALDGVRGVAILAVIAIHVGVLPGGYLGVDVFFVLSGFLITSLLIGEWDKRDGVSFRNFYLRRALRLLPALACVLAAAGVLSVLLEFTGPPVDRAYGLATLHTIPWVIIFSSNFVQATHPGLLPLGALRHTWSLAVEEQFYLVWPALFALLMRRGVRRRTVAGLLGAFAIADMAYRALLAFGGSAQDRVFYSTDTHCDGLLVGCALAFWLTSGQAFRFGPLAARLIKGASWAGAVILLAAFLLARLSDSPVEIDVAVLSTAMLVTGIVCGQAPAPIDRFLSSPGMVAIGRRSYALYLWHDLLLGVGEALVVPYTGLFPAAGGHRILFASVLAAAIALSFVLADLSYRYVELPALRLKQRFSRGDLSGSLRGGPEEPVLRDLGPELAKADS
jgi:peptidoglycan/LPS O-acetylase OafA/YrhL